jgi:hypothetical protein
MHAWQGPCGSWGGLTVYSGTDVLKTLACVALTLGFGRAAAGSDDPEPAGPIEIKPGGRIVSSFPFNLARSEPIILSTRDGVKNTIAKLAGASRGKGGKAGIQSFLAKWSAYQRKLAAAGGMIGDGAHHSIGEHFTVHWGIPYKQAQPHVKVPGMLVPRLDRIFGANAFRCTDWMDTDFFIFKGKRGYDSYLADLLKQKRITEDDFELMLKCDSVGGPHVMVMNAEGQNARTLSHQLTHSFGKMLVQRVGRLKTDLPVWLTVGFGSYCEVISHSADPRRPQFEQAFIRSVEYELTDEKFDWQWIKHLKDQIRKKKVMHLRYLITSDLAGLSAIHQYQIRSLVYFLIHGGPGFSRKFLKLLSALKSGEGQKAALRKAYRTSVERLDPAWRMYCLQYLR